ncbi:MAG: tetratricopeptide repeat protein, partial [Ferruginibacter sp.]
MPAYERLYRYAEKLYDSENATPATDSIALVTYMQVSALLNKEKNYNEILADSYLKSGILQMSANDQERALDNFRAAISTTRRNGHLPDSLLFKPYLYGGSIHYNLNNLDSAVYYFNRAEAINNRYAGLDESERLFNKLGALYYETGDYKKSIIYFEKALSIVEGKKPVNVYFIVNYKNNIATALIKSGAYKKALEIFTDLLQYHISEDELCYNIGNAYIEEGDYNSAQQFLKRISQMDLEKYNSIAKVFISLRQYDSAQLYITKATNAFFDKKYSSKKLDYGITLKYSGDLQAATGNTFKAIADYQLAITHLYPDFTDTSIISNPASFSGLQNFTLLFDALAAKAASFNVLNSQQPNRHYLEQSLYAYTSALSLANHIEHTYFSDDARLFLKQKVNPATQEAVDIAIRLFNQSKNSGYYLNIAFGFVENNKASVLQAGLQNLQLSAIPGLPAGLIAEEKNYKSFIAKLAIQSAKVKDSLSLSMLQKKIRDNEIALATVQQKLDENTLYHRLKFTARVTNIDSIQHRFTDQDEAILSYYYTAKNLLCFYITKEEAGLSSVPLKNNFLPAIFSLRKELEQPQASSRKSLQDAGSALFQELVAPVSEKIKNKKRLVIIPYNEIGYVPFEMMPDIKDGELLLNKFAISYNYSANFLGEKKEEPGSSYDVLAMAPFSEKANPAMVLPSLPSS